MGRSMKEEYFSKAKRGPVVKTAKAKTRITTRLDSTILGSFRSQANKADGATYQSKINEALGQHIATKRA